MFPIKRMLVTALSLHAFACAVTMAQAQNLSSSELLQALQAGGNVIVMRQACAPRVFPDQDTAQLDNTTLDRQLDETGRRTAIAMGKALRELRIPIGTVYSSPTYRALQTVTLAQLPTAITYPELSDGGGIMVTASPGQSNWLQYRATHFPKNSNTLIVTHLPNIRGAFPEFVSDLADGEALVFGPEGKSGSALLARVRIEDWPVMASK